jgi:hypothetical protein
MTKITQITFKSLWMTFKGRKTLLKAISYVPVVCLWCLGCAYVACGLPVVRLWGLWCLWCACGACGFYRRPAETVDFDHDTFQICWNWSFKPWHIPVMLKLTIISMTQSSHAETDNFDHDIFGLCWKWRFWPWHILVICGSGFSTLIWDRDREWLILQEWDREMDWEWEQIIFREWLC